MLKNLRGDFKPGCEPPQRVSISGAYSESGLPDSPHSASATAFCLFGGKWGVGSEYCETLPLLINKGES